ncbi:MAG TPA: bifunctional adenosylcobinamide kinase/adenosylcobinamide-phosphate guanylyltransferase [Bacillota bacterium]|nr:bifunctional adenosylcobinamide kinase/adenosylcobinamide-phosphate guanylyltransferase [Bacillota bacterium]HOR86411.1 bifunctional adenosylcobinamide kinase/adenosylcobinamide-phosphate guanylyltransferase [Bacillota bacterium]HPL54450.1 bifunctional adenosylcobinamide kinase/adenosylcobinamide-phosphate guanylyltransferase [Bacillota bacterium]
MGRAILITGGARSGKSSYAEKLAKELGGSVLYIATSIPFDEEMKNRVKRHRESRPAGWDTYEGFKGLGPLIAGKGSEYNVILLDCITLMITNLLLEHQDMDYEETERKIKKEIEKLLMGVAKTKAVVIMVSNEIGSGIVPENPLTRAFRDIAGRMNQHIAEQCGEVFLTVCGLPLKLK